MTVLQVGYIFLGGTGFPLSSGVRNLRAGAVVLTAGFTCVCRLEALQIAGQEVPGCSWCFVCALCLAVLGYCLCVVAVSDLFKPSLFSSLLWSHHPFYSVLLSPLPGHYPLCVSVRQLLDNSM